MESDSDSFEASFDDSMDRHEVQFEDGFVSKFDEANFNNDKFEANFDDSSQVNNDKFEANFNDACEAGAQNIDAV